MKKIVNVKIRSLNYGIKSVSIDDPKTYNSLSLKTIKSLRIVFKILNKDDSTKVIILEGSGNG